MGKLPFRGILIAVAVLGLVVFIASQSNGRTTSEEQSLSYFLGQVEANGVNEITVKGTELQVTPQKW